MVVNEIQLARASYQILIGDEFMERPSKNLKKAPAKSLKKHHLKSLKRQPTVVKLLKSPKQLLDKRFLRTDLPPMFSPSTVDMLEEMRDLHNLK